VTTSQPITVPQFHGDSFIVVTLKRTPSRSLSFEIWFLTYEPDGKTRTHAFSPSYKNKRRHFTHQQLQTCVQQYMTIGTPALTLRLVQWRCCVKCNKCSAVAEMGDRLATIDMDRKLGAVLLWRGDLGPHLTNRATDPRLVCKFREIWPTGSRWNRALLTWQKKQKIGKRSRARFCADRAKIYEGQLQTIYSECPKLHPNPFTSGGVIAKRVNVVQTRHKVFPILGEASASTPSKKTC